MNDSGIVKRTMICGIASPSAPPSQRTALLVLLPSLLIIAVITAMALPLFTSGTRIIPNADFLQFLSRHEGVRRSLLDFHAFPIWSHWFGGGYPTIGDPEDPALNPLVLFSVVFGAARGLKLITYVALLIGGCSTYAFARHILGYTRWGALYSGLVFGTCPFIPRRVLDGNPNEVYAAFIPLCLLLIGLGARGVRSALLFLPVVLLTMLSDGKTNALTAMLYVGLVCVAEWLLPAEQGSNARAVKYFLIAMVMTALLGMARILPCLDLLHSHGGAVHLLPSHPKTYQPDGIRAYSVRRLCRELVGWHGRTGPITVGWIPLLLTGLALLAFWRATLAWVLVALLFCWLALAHNAPYDLLKLAWHLPIFDTIYRPNKYFTFQIVFSLALVGGRSFDLLRRLRFRWAEAAIASVVIGSSVSFLYSISTAAMQKSYSQPLESAGWPSSAGFFSVQGESLARARVAPPRALAYYNLQQNVGTVDWYTGIPLGEHAVPKYLVSEDNHESLNPAYRGEAFVLGSSSADREPVAVTIEPNHIRVQGVIAHAPRTIVINQNFDRDWRASAGTLFEREGLLAVALPQPGPYQVDLRYRPRAFYAGLAVSGCSLALLLWICWAYRSSRLARWAQGGTSLAARGSRAVLWLIE
jgi:hypothetical protein